jgi:hypothetical protein
MNAFREEKDRDGPRQSLRPLLPQADSIPAGMIGWNERRFAAGARHNPKGTERDDQHRALWIIRDRHGPTTPVRLVGGGQTGDHHHPMRQSLGSGMRYGNVGEIAPDVIWETLVAV